MLGNVKDRITVDVVIRNIYRTYNDYGNLNIYIMETQNGDSVIWKTSTEMSCNDDFIKEDSIISIMGTIKKHGEYKGNPQIELTRCKVNKVIKMGMTQQQKDEARKAEQIASLKGDDFIWTMPYRQYKEHYSDCETVTCSFRRENGIAKIGVIIREGRLKASGTRGKQFHSYKLRNSNGDFTVYVAVNGDNAVKHAERDFPGETWEVDSRLW